MKNMKQSFHRAQIILKLKLQKVWLGFWLHPRTRQAHRAWRGMPRWGRTSFGLIVIGAGITGVLATVNTSHAIQKTYTISSSDIQRGTAAYGGIKVASDGSSLQLQDGVVGSWDQSGVNGMQVMPSGTNAPSHFAYGPNNTLYGLSSIAGACYFRKYDTEKQLWAQVQTPPVFCGAGSILVYDGAGGFFYAPGGPSAAPSNRIFRYDIAKDSWLRMADFPSTIGETSDGTLVTQGSKRYIYIFRGQSSPSFWRYSLNDNSWQNLASFPTTGTVSSGVTLSWDGATTIYALANGSGEFKKYDLTLGTWSNLTNVSGFGNVNQSLTFLNGTLYSMRLNYGNWYWGLYAYNPASATWTTLPGNSYSAQAYGFPPPLTSDGSRYLYTVIGPEIRQQPLRYDTVNATWNTNSLLLGSSVQAMYHQIPAYDGAQSLYYVGGQYSGNSDRVFKYDMPTNTASQVGAQINTQSGSVGAYYNGSVYFLPIYNTTTVFQKYDTATNAFSPLADAPFTSNYGSSIIYGGDGYMYVTFGGRGNFYSYNISANTWTALTSMPQAIYGGGGAVRIGRTIYVLGANSSSNFYAYNMDSGTWGTITSLPAGSIDHGAFIASDTSRYLYIGLSDRTNNQARMIVRYDTTNNTWVRIADLPQASYINAAAYFNTNSNKLYVVGGHNISNVWSWSPGTTSYVTAGTWYSGTYDLKQVSIWQSLQATVGGSGTTQFYTRTSANGNIWTDWQLTSGTAIQSPVNRYIQVKIVLSGNGTTTPTVSGLSIGYDQETTAPSLPSQFTAYSEKGGTTLSSGATSSSQHPYFTWNGADDGVNGSGIAGYNVYFGTDSAADPAVTGNYQTTTDYVVDLPMTAGDVYYLRIKAVDALGNSSSAATFFSYRYFYISPPGSQVRTSNDDFSQGINSGVNITNGTMSLPNVSTGSWSTGPVAMPPDNTSGATMAVVGDSVYAARGASTGVFWRYNTVTMTWSTLTPIPTNVNNGASMTYDGNDTLYLMAGNNTTSFYKYSIANNLWTAMPALPSNAQIGADIRYIGNDRIIVFLTGVREFYMFTISTGTYTPLSTYPTTISMGGSGIWYDGNDTIYAYLGAWDIWSTGRGRLTMATYTISTDTWRTLSTSPISATYTQNNLLSDGHGGLYVFTSDLVDSLAATQRAFRYDIASDSWSEVKNVPFQSYNGTAVSDNSRYFYILPSGNGTNSRRMVRYDTWTQQFTPSAIGIGSLDRLPWDYPVNAYQWIAGNATTATYDGSQYIYALMGSESTNSTSRFVKYDYKTGQTVYLTSPPTIGASGSMAYLGDFIYYLPGKSTKTLYRYDMNTRLWSMMSDMPSAVYRPGSSTLLAVDGNLYVFAGNSKLLYKYTPNASGGTYTAMAQSPANIQNGSAYYDSASNALYVIAGNNTTAYYRYSIANNSWTTLANLPLASNYGSAMTLKNGKVYAMLGNLTKTMYVYDISANSWSQGTASPEQFNYGAQMLDVSNTYALVFAGSGSPDIWQFNYPSTTTSYTGQATHISTNFTTAGLFDYANVTANVSIPQNTAVEFWTRSSSDETNWEDWKLLSEVKTYTNSISGKVNSTPQRFTQIKAVLISYDNISTPTVNDYSLNYYYDVDPPTNPTTFDAYTDNTKATPLLNNTWYNKAQPYLDWPEPGEAGGATDGPLGSNVAGYWVYVGTDPTATPRTAGVFVPTSEYTPNLTLSGTYYVRIQAQDMTGNVDSAIFSPFIYKFDNVPPTNPSLVTVTPSGFTTRNNYTFEWPNAYDADSDVAGYCYYTGAPDGPFAVETCQDGTKLENISAAYQNGTNVFYVRAYDKAGNYAPSYTSASYYFTTDPPGPVTNLRAVPPTSTSNLFAFTWDLPIVYSGDPDQMTYCYSINILPSPQNTTCTSDRFISAFKAATQKGTNIIYMVAKDEAGNANWNSFASANFIANTVSPGIPLNVTASDTSDRNTSRWTITLTWDKPTFEGNGIKDYVVQRSLDGHTFATIGNTSTRAFVDLDVQLDTQYYYRVAAEDSVENMSGFSGIVIQSAKGTFNTPPSVVVEPQVTVGFDQAKITWATNRGSTTFVYYGTTPTDLSQSKGSLELVTDHSITITGLSPSRTYYYRIQSFDNDRSYNLTDAYSDIATFRTTAAAQLADVKVSDITADSAVVSWSTTVPTHARIQYGANTSYGLSLDDEAGSYTTVHTTKLTSLSSGTLYHFKINSTTAFGSTLSSDDYTFTTIARPIISDIRFQPLDNETNAGVRVSWSTNVPTSSTVRYQALGKSLESSLSELVTQHSIELHDLASNTEYQFTFEGRDQYGNQASSSVQRWTSQVDTRPPELSELNYTVTTTDTGKGKQAQLIVTWKTDEPATSQIAYGGMNDKVLSKTTPLDTEPTTNHVVVLSGLNLADIYKIQVISRDLDGNTAKGSVTTVVTPDKQLNVFDTILNLMLQLFRF
jgi:hypothetical protein